MMCFKWEKCLFFQEEVTAEESTDGEVEAQTYTQDSQDSIGEVSVFEEQESSAEIAICPPNSVYLEGKSQM